MEKVPQKTIGVVLSFLLWAGVLTSFAFAQLPTATVLGVVKDSSGAVVPDTALTARNVDTGQTRSATSAGDGSYRFAALAVGSYEIRAEHAGFQTSVRTGLTLAVGQEAVVNLALEVGAVTQTVAVTAEASLVDTTSGTLGGLVSEQKVADLPLNGRNYIDLALLQPGITLGRNMASTRTAVGDWLSGNGMPIRSNNYMLDGAVLTTEAGINSSSQAGTTLGIDGIREYRVVTNNAGAEYGMVVGAQITMVSKGGTNRFHGDVFEYLRNNDLDARNFFDYTTPNRLPAYKRDQFGGAFGGPIRKDKTFFYGVYEALRQRLGLTIIDNVMAAGCHGPAGATITFAQCPQLTAAVPSKVISPTMAPLLALFPAPDLPNNQYTYPFTSPTRDDFGQMRVDQVFSSNDSLFARYTIEDAAVTTGVTSISGVAGVTSFPQFSAMLLSRGQFGTLSENHIFSSTVLNSARFSYSRTAPATFTPTNIIGPQYSFVTGQPIGSVTISGLTALGPQSLSPSFSAQNVFAWSDDLFYTRGKHSLKFGALVNRFQQYDEAGRIYRGTVTFSSLANFLVGTASTYGANTTTSIDNRAYRFTMLGFYAADDFRVSSRLTLNLGLRYEPMTQLHEIRGYQSALPNILTDATPTVGVPFVNPSLHNFAPRLGFAWDVAGDGKTAVRGGFGEFFDLGSAMFGSAIDVVLPTNAPFSRTLSVTTPTTITIPFTFAPQNVTNQYGELDYHMQQPHMLSYNLGVERQLPGGLALTLTYAGSRGYNLMAPREGNPIVPGGIPVNGVCVARPTGQAVNYSQPTCWLPGDPRTNPAFGSMTLETAQSNSWYNALQVGLKKQLSKGLQFQGSYVYSKSIDTIAAQGQTEYSTQANFDTDPVHPLIDKGLSAFDATHNFRFNAIYQLPHPFSGALGKLLNGWQTSGILSLQTGQPFSPVVNANRSLSGVYNSATAVDRPNLVAGRNNGNITSGVSTSNGIDPCPTAGQALGTQTLWFDPCAFTIPAAGFLGTSGRNILRGPGLANLDFSLVKNTAIKYLGEGGRLEFRAEFFNILNRVNFLAPGRTVYSANANVETPLAAAGVITGTATSSRQIQFALKLVF